MLLQSLNIIINRRRIGELKPKRLLVESFSLFLQQVQHGDESFVLNLSCNRICLLLLDSLLALLMISLDSFEVGVLGESLLLLETIL